MEASGQLVTRTTDTGRIIQLLHGVLYRLEGQNFRQIPIGKRLDKHPGLRQYEIGRYSWGHVTVSSRTPGAQLHIGQFCSFAYGTHILLGGEHRTDFVSTYRFAAYPPFSVRHGHLAADTTVTKGDVFVGNDVWIGHEALIMSGVQIGDGVVVGAGSVVRKHAPPYAILAGNPARVVGYRFPREQIDALLRIKWWDWAEERIMDSLDLLLSDDIQRFIDAYDPEAREVMSNQFAD